MTDTNDLLEIILGL